ncbi:intracellular protein transport protein USO1-like isoform X2 [Aristolochia californica]|uniref:intracellular protein transport protein USO1-like isoform X2 n=1 Tax=Aristolochia californica TaxID=171875 RepID=UPI0035E1820F
MFKAARWRSEKNKIKALFKLQFKATQVPRAGWDGLMVSLVPLEHGRPTVKTVKAVVDAGACEWENPLYETVRFNQDPKTGKISEKIYRIFVQTGSSRNNILGEVAIDFANYAEAIKPSTVCLPARPSSSGIVLHVTIQRIQAAADRREEENGAVAVQSNGRTLKSHLSIIDTDERSEVANDLNNYISTEDNSSISDQAQLIVPHTNGASRNADSNGFTRASSGSDDISGSGLESSSEQNTPKGYESKSNNVHRDVASFFSSLRNNSTSQNPAEHRRSNTDWSVSSGPDGSTDDSTNSSDNTITKEKLKGSDISIEKLKNDLIVMARQAEVSELELQTLKKQIVKESKRGQDLSKEIGILKEERDALKSECEQLKASQQKVNNSQFESDDPRYILEEIRQELNYEKDVNVNLRVQLQKTQESNSELILAVRDLEELLGEKKRETSRNPLNETAVRLELKDNNHAEGSSSVQSKSNGEGEVWETVLKQEEEDDEEQHALEELVREHDETRTHYSLEQKFIDLCSEIEVYKKDREEIEMQMEQLALDYEILKQQNHDISSRLEQSQLYEQLKMQYESSASLAVISELETHIENLEKELEKQAEAFEADLAELAQSKVEQEQRAIRAEEALRKMKLNNASIAERLQAEFRRLSLQMSSTFEGNEKLTMQAQAEATELRVQNCELKGLLEKANEELALMRDQNEAKLEDALNQLEAKVKQMDQLVAEMDKGTQEVQNLKKYGEDRENNLLEELQKLQTELAVIIKERNELYKLAEENEALKAEMQRMKESFEEERKMLLSRGNVERDALKELNEMRQMKDEKDAIVSVLQSDKEVLRSQYNELKHTLFECELGKENLQKQVLHLKGDLQKKDDTIAIIEKKLTETSSKVTLSDGTEKTSPKTTNKASPPSRGSKEVAALQEKIKVLEGEIKLKEAALESSTDSFLKKEKDLSCKIEELKKCLADLRQSKPNSCGDECQKGENEYAESEEDVSAKVESNRIAIAEDGKDEINREASSNSFKQVLNMSLSTDIDRMEDSTSNGYSTECSSEMAHLKVRNKSMEIELKEMQERYSEISLRFAEVEGERQQLVMMVRNLKNAKKS